MLVYKDMPSEAKDDDEKDEDDGAFLDAEPSMG
jgi:hypothetical protein